MSSASTARLFAMSFAGSIILSLAVCVDSTDVPAPSSPPPGPKGGEPKPMGTGEAQPTFQCNNPPTLSYKIPPILSQTNQAGADCFAWQLFIALNWPASSTRGAPDQDAGVADFGAPNDYAAVVWETYKDISDVFLEGGAPPKPWGAPPPPANCAQVTKHVHIGGIPLQPSTGEFTSIGEFKPNDGMQAGPSNANGRNWLADQNGDLIWYESALNQTEFDYIVDGGLYSAAGQYARVDAGVGIDPPAQSTEIKAAWRKLPSGADTSRYLVMSACIPGPGGTPELATLGLVGLHIVHKASNQPQWVWATFEQVDNVPESADAGGSYTFYNPSCDPTRQPPIPPACLGSDAGAVTRRSCSANELPAYNLARYAVDGGCPPYPVQVTRKNPIPSSKTSPAQPTNAAVQAMIAEQAPQSVFRYYQLVNAIWWSSPNDPNTTPRPIPLTTLGANHVGDDGANLPVANTVLETYTQGDDCLTCHASAPLAAAPDGGASKVSANFSFVFGHAQWPSGAGPTPKPAPSPKGGAAVKRR